MKSENQNKILTATVKKTSLFVLLIIALTFSNFDSSKAQGLFGSVVSLTGSVYNEITRLPETVAIIVLDENGEKVTSTRSIANDNGYYYLTGLKMGKNYTVRLKKKEFLEETWKFSVAKEGSYVELSHDFLIKPSTAGTMIKIQVPPFELNKSKLRFGAEFLLEDLKNTLALNDKVKFEVVCYPDNTKDPNENQELTDERAKALVHYFLDNGIAQNRIIGVGSKTVDALNPPPSGKLAKGKRYVGTSYIKIISAE